MATVVITFFLFARINVCKMDADCKEKRREWCIPTTKIVEQHDRFSMDPQRFEEILAEITTGYGNIRNGFENVNIAEILEEMVTEFARAALEAAEAPKFTELAVLLQHCAQLYGRKVDYLYQHVLDVSEALATAQPEAESPQSSGGKRKRRSSGALVTAGGFTHITVEACAGATRAAEPPRAPPTLPRMYIELEPRAPAPHDTQLCDLAGEPVGLPHDYHVTARLRDGLLLDELEEGRTDARAPLRPLSLLELQEALAAAAPQDDALCDPPLSPLLTPNTPAPLLPDTPAPLLPDTSALPPDSPADPHIPALPDTPLAPPVALARRKRRSSAKLADIIDSPIKIFRMDSGWRAPVEFSVPSAWVERVVCARARRVLDARLALDQVASRKFVGFEDMHPERGGFPGWSAEEVCSALSAAAATGASLRASDIESDDDGFYENSSLSSLDSSRSTPPPAAPAPPPPPPPPPPAPAPLAPAEWSARVAARAVEEEARGGVDVRALAATLLSTLPAEPPHTLPFEDVLRRGARHPRDVSRLLLATLFLANSGNVEIVDSSPRALGAFSVTLRSTDERLYAAAAEAEAALLAPPPPEQQEPPPAEQGLQEPPHPHPPAEREAGKPALSNTTDSTEPSEPT